MSGVVVREAEVLRVKPDEFLLIKLTGVGEDEIEVAESFVADLVAAGLERGRFVIVNGDGIEFAVVEAKP